MSDQDSDYLMREAAFGMNVEAFLETPIGVYLIEKAEADIRDAQAELAVIDPHDWKAVQSLQNSIRVAESVQMWLAEAVSQGTIARQIIEDRNA